MTFICQNRPARRSCTSILPGKGPDHLRQSQVVHRGGGQTLQMVLQIIGQKTRSPPRRRAPGAKARATPGSPGPPLKPGKGPPRKLAPGPPNSPPPCGLCSSRPEKGPSPSGIPGAVQLAAAQQQHGIRAAAERREQRRQVLHPRRRLKGVTSKSTIRPNMARVQTLVWVGGRGFGEGGGESPGPPTLAPSPNLLNLKKFSARVWPWLVRKDSGWNWTPWEGVAAVAEAHDHAVFGPGGDFQFCGVGDRHQGVVARRAKGEGSPAKRPRP